MDDKNTSSSRLTADLAFPLLFSFPVLVIKSGARRLIDFSCFTLASILWVRNGLGVNIDGIPSTSSCQLPPSQQYCVSIFVRVRGFNSSLVSRSQTTTSTLSFWWGEDDN